MKQARKRFVFAGFDFFLDAADELVKHGWELTGFCATDQDEMVSSSRRLKHYGAAAGAKNFGSQLSKSAYDAMRDIGIDYLITAGYGFRVPVSEIQGFRAINFHPTLLPNGRGPWPFPYLLERPEYAGVTIHEIVEGFDEGPILVQHPISVSTCDNCHTLEYKCKLAGISIAKVLAVQIDDLFLNRRQQTGSSSYWRMPRWERERLIDFQSSVMTIDRQVRSYGDYQTKAYFGERSWSVKSVSVWQEQHDYFPSEVVIDDDRYTLVAALDGYVLFLDYCEYVPRNNRPT